MPTSYHHGDLYAALVTAGQTLLESEGLEKLSLRAVARAAGVSPSAPYRHFRDKKNLLAAIATQGFITLNTGMQRSIRHAPDDLDATGQAYLKFALKHPEVYRLMFTRNLLCDSDTPDESLENSSGDAFGTLESVIARGVESGRIAKVDAPLLALTAWSLVHGLALLLIDGVLDKSPYVAVKPAQLLSGCQAILNQGWTSPPGA